MELNSSEMNSDIHASAEYRANLVVIQAKKAEFGAMNIQHMSSSKVSAQTLHVYGEISGSGTNTLIKKNHLHRNVVQNNTDAHRGLVFSGGRLSV